MKTKALFITIFSLLLCACSNDNESSADQNYQLTKSVVLLNSQSDPEDGFITEYFYDTQNKLMGYSEGYIEDGLKFYTITYNGNGKIVKLENTNNQESVEYDYDVLNINQVTKKIETFTNGSQTYNYSYENNNIIEDFRESISGSLEQKRNVFTYDVKGNLIEKKEYSNISSQSPEGTLTGTFIYTYDDKKNPDKLLPPELNHLYSFTNNLLTEQYNNNAVQKLFTYTYNGSGYVSKSVGTTYTTLYEYKKI